MQTNFTTAQLRDPQIQAAHRAVVKILLRDGTDKGQVFAGMFIPARSSTLLIGRLVLNIWPGPCVKTPSNLTPLYSPTCCRYFQWMREKATELIDEVAPLPGNSASNGRTWRAGV